MLSSGIIKSGLFAQTTTIKPKSINCEVQLSDSCSKKNTVSVGKALNEMKYYIKSEKLSADFLPGPFDVICGRRKTISLHSGNRRYSELVKSILPRYCATLSKVEKTILVTSVINRVEQASPEGGFVKEIGGQWYKVSESYAREKIGQRWVPILTGFLIA